MRLLTASALSLLARCRSGETPLFIRLITTSPDRIGFWHAGRHARVGFGTDLGALASGPRIAPGGRRTVRRRARRTSGAGLRSSPAASRSRAGQEPGRPPGALHPAPPRAATERGQEIGTRQRRAGGA